uniref:Putative thioredoxin/protein disulfide isomerase n=1 Tax=Corethrella appendiculata TaxID=1370023 RepID=U5EEM2_9DIPT
MKYLKYSLLIIILFSFITNSICFEFRGLEFLAHFLNGEFFESKSLTGGSKHNNNNSNNPNADDEPSKGQTKYSFVDFITYNEKNFCFYEQQSLAEEKNNENRRAQLKVKCIPANGNGTLYVINSVTEVINLLAPTGNSTKRNQAGHCVVVLFYAKSCIHSSIVAPHYNALARQFPDITVAAIDAFKFHALNTEFGINGLPTIMFFHRGRPLVKFNDTQPNLNNFIKFVTKHSGIKHMSSATLTSDDFTGPLRNKIEKETDYWLYVAWIFIIMCCCYYFTKSSLYTQIVEMVKRNWRESVAHHHGS